SKLSRVHQGALWPPSAGRYLLGTRGWRGRPGGTGGTDKRGEQLLLSESRPTTAADPRPQMAVNEPFGLARAALVHLERASRFGVPRAELLREARLNEDQLRDPDARVPRSAIVRLWRAVASRVPDSAFGLRYGAEFRLREFGLVGYAMAFSRT